MSYSGKQLCSIYSTRLKIAILLLLGLFLATLMRICLSVAVICIVTKDPEPNITYSAEMQISELSLHGKQNSMGWSDIDITLLLSATFFGGLLTAFWSGYLSDRFAPKYIILFGIADCVIVTGLTPLLAESNFYALFFARVAMGLGEDFMSPATTSFINRWFAPTEMTRIGSFTMTGRALAGTVGFPVSSQLCQMQTLGGWKLMFYLFAGIGVTWIAIWLWYASNAPAHHKYISQTEEDYVRKELEQLEINHNPETPKLYTGGVPWKSIITSGPILVNLICQFTFNFSEAIFSAFLPMFLAQVLQINLKNNGYMAMISFVVQLCCQVLFGACTDFINKKQLWSSTISCKIFQACQNLLCAIAYFGLGFFVTKNKVLICAIFLILNGIGIAAGVSGFMTSQPSLAPQYAGILSSILRITAALGALASINIVGFFNRKGTPDQWQVIWSIAAGLNLITGIIFLFGGTAETQSWGKTNNKDDQNKREKPINNDKNKWIQTSDEL